MMRRQHGFTLIELMIAMALGIFVVGAIFGVFSNQTKQLVYQDLQMEMHQSLRLATDSVSRTARMGGYGTDGQTLGILGFAGGSASTAQAMPAIISYDGTGPNGSDAITVVTMDPGLSMYTNFSMPADCSSNRLPFNTTVFDNDAKLAQFSAGEMVMCMDYAPIGGYTSYIWQISSVDTNNGELVVVPNSTIYTDYANDCTENLPMVMVCSRAEVATFYIDNDDTDGIGAGSSTNPVLMMDLDFNAPGANDVPVVDNIEDMQFEYCLRSTIGATTCDTTAAWVNTIDDYNDNNNANDPDDVYMIRVSFIVRSSREDPQDLYAGSRPALANNTAGSGTDHYFRQAQSTEVTVRNMRLLNLP